MSIFGEGDYDKITRLFTHDATATSSSGISDNPEHFYKTLFTQTISHPKSRLINIFEGTLDTNMMVGYFHFSWHNTTGKNVSAMFLDLFVFDEQTSKIKAIYVFSNTFNKDIMKQLNR